MAKFSKHLKYRHLYFYLILFVFLFLSKQNIAQLSKSEITVSYIYNFAKHTELIKRKNIKTYNIALLTENQNLIKEFEKFERETKIKNKPVKIKNYSSSKIDTLKTSLIFIASDKSDLFPEIYNLTKEKQIVIVTENYPNKRKIMLNLFETNDNKIEFEINKENFRLKKIKFSDELLLMGGTVIDQHELYQNLQKKLASSERKLNEVQAKMSDLNRKIKETQKKDKRQEIKIKNQINLIYSQKKEQEKLLSKITRHKKEIETQKKEIEVQKKLLYNEKTKLLVFSDSLKKSKKLLDKHKGELKNDIKTLQNLRDEIRKKNMEINVQESTLGEQYEIIEKKNTINNLLYALSALAVLLVVFLLTMVLYRKRKNEILRKQKEEITGKNLVIKDHLEKKRLINSMLKDKNEELSNIISQLKDTQQQLIQSEKMASLGVLAAGIAHEINNPINFVFAGVNSLKKDFDDIEIIINKIKELDPNDKNLKDKILEIEDLKNKHYFDEAIEAIPEIILGIKDGASRTAEIIAGLRTFARTDYEEYVPMDIHESIDASLLILKNKYKNIIDLQRNYDKTIPKVNCNPGKISQVLINVISNAIDAILEKKDNKNGKIVINTTYKNSKIQISVKDNGKGMPEHIKEKIFDPFFTTKKIGKGTGLGLSISYGIIKEHGGKMKVNSETGKGTEFTIILPENK